MVSFLFGSDPQPHLNELMNKIEGELADDQLTEVQKQCEVMGIIPIVKPPN